jgi:hypothetical protein
MAGTYRGRVNCFMNVNDKDLYAQQIFTNIYHFLKNQLEPAGVVTEVARQGGLSCTAMNQNYSWEKDPFLANAWFVFKWNVNANRTWPWYLLVQYTPSSVDPNAAPGYPCKMNNIGNDTYSKVMVAAAIGIGGTQNPWNGAGTMGTNTKGTPVWRIPPGGTNVAIVPRSNLGDLTYGSRAKGQIMPVAGSLLIDGETFTLNDGLNGNKVFEFDSTGSITPGRTPVAFTAGSTIQQVSDSIALAINTLVTGDFFIAAKSNPGGTVTLVNNQPGVIGNNTITETVANAGFLVQGMVGGTGYCENTVNLRYALSTSWHFVHLLADDDCFLFGATASGSTDANTHYFHFMGTYTPRPGIVCEYPFVSLRFWPPNSDMGIHAYTSDENTAYGGEGILGPGAVGMRNVRFSRIEEFFQANPNFSASPLAASKSGPFGWPWQSGGKSATTASSGL